MELREPAVAYGKRKFTIEEYLEMENTSVENISITGEKYLQCQALKCRIMRYPGIFMLHYIIG